MIRRPPRSTLFPYTNALPISPEAARRVAGRQHGHERGTHGRRPRRGGRIRRGYDERQVAEPAARDRAPIDRKSTRLNSSHLVISYAVFCLKKKKKNKPTHDRR